MAEDTVRCMLLPLQGMQLVVPNAAVAEIIGYGPPAESRLSEHWLDGELPWRGVFVPVISLEKLCGGALDTPGPRSRIAVLYGASAQTADLPYFGLILQDIPRAYLAEPERMQGLQTATDCDYLWGQAELNNPEILIPDFDQIIAAIKHQLVH